VPQLTAALRELHDAWAAGTLDDTPPKRATPTWFQLGFR